MQDPASLETSIPRDSSEGHYITPFEISSLRSRRDNAKVKMLDQRSQQSSRSNSLSTAFDHLNSLASMLPDKSSLSRPRECESANISRRGSFAAIIPGLCNIKTLKEIKKEVRSQYCAGALSYRSNSQASLFLPTELGIVFTEGCAIEEDEIEVSGTITKQHKIMTINEGAESFLFENLLIPKPSEKDIIQDINKYKIMTEPVVESNHSCESFGKDGPIAGKEEQKFAGISVLAENQNKSSLEDQSRNDQVKIYLRESPGVGTPAINTSEELENRNSNSTQNTETKPKESKSKTKKSSWLRQYNKLNSEELSNHQIKERTTALTKLEQRQEKPSIIDQPSGANTQRDQASPDPKQKLQKKSSEKISKTNSKRNSISEEVRNSRPKTAGTMSTKIAPTVSRIASAKVNPGNQSVLNKSNSIFNESIDTSFEHVNGKFRQKSKENIRKVPSLILTNIKGADNGVPKIKQSIVKPSGTQAAFRKTRSSSIQANSKDTNSGEDPAGTNKRSLKNVRNSEKASDLFPIQEQENKTQNKKDKGKRNTNNNQGPLKKPSKVDKSKDNLGANQPAPYKKSSAKTENSIIKRQGTVSSKVPSQNAELIKKRFGDRKYGNESNPTFSNSTDLKLQIKRPKIGLSCNPSHQNSCVPSPRNSVLNTERAIFNENEPSNCDQERRKKKSVSPLKKVKNSTGKLEKKLQKDFQHISNPTKVNQREKLSEIMTKACDY